MDFETKLLEFTELVNRLASVQVAAITQSPAIQAAPTEGSLKFSFGEFVINGLETLDEYFERFEIQLKLCKIPENKWADCLRVHMGAELNSCLRNVSYPTDINTLTFQQMQSMLLEHLIAIKNKYSETIKFRQLVQAPGESVSTFISRLKAGARYCKFEEFLDYSMIVQFIHGVRSDHIRNKVIAKKPDKFEDVIKIALEMEATREAAAAFKPPQAKIYWDQSYILDWGRLERLWRWACERAGGPGAMVPPD